MDHSRPPSSNLRQLDFDWAEVEASRIDPQQIFDRATVESLKALTENDFFDRKSLRIDARALAETVCAFSNGAAGRGGVIAIGLTDTGDPDSERHGGVSKLNSLQKELLVLCPLAEYVPRFLEHGTSTILLLKVSYSSERVIERSDGAVFKRIGDSDHRLSPEAIVHLRYDKGEVSFESVTMTDASLEDLDHQLLAQFADAVRAELDLQHDRSIEDVLIQRRLGSKENGLFRPRHSGYWLFAKDPVKHFPGCKIRFIRYEGTSERTGADLNVIKDIVIEGPVPVLIQRAAEAVLSQLREYRALRPDGTFELVNEYPVDCVREAIVNACVHRSYSMRNSNIFIRMFDNRLEFESPGGFLPPVTPETIYDHHAPRNPLMMDGVRFLKFVRCANEGTRRMRHLMHGLGLPPPVFSESKGVVAKVVVTLHNNIEHRRIWVDRDLDGLIGEQLAKALTPEEKRVLNYLAENGRMNVSDCLRITTARKWHAARKIMNGLLAKGLIKENKERPRDPGAHFVLSSAWRSA